MSTDFKSIPIIDISLLLAKCDDPRMGEDPGVADVVRQLDQACREAGFFYVRGKNMPMADGPYILCRVFSSLWEYAIFFTEQKGHGIPDSLIKEVRALSHQFFELPYEEKLKIRMTSAAGYRGYQRVGENITKGVPDMHEAIDCYREVKPGMYGDLGKVMEGCNQWPVSPPALKPIMEEYVSLCTDLSRKIMRGVALALGGSPFEFEGERAGDPFWVLRIIGYPAASKANGHGNPDNDIGCGAHTDYGLLTLVNQDDDITALQVRNLSGEWICAVPVPGTFVCNIGDMLKIWSNGLYDSTLHRVINNSPRYRVCIAYFYEPNFDVNVEPLDVCIRRTGGTKKFGRAVYGEHLAGKVQTNFVV